MTPKDTPEQLKKECTELCKKMGNNTMSIWKIKLVPLPGTQTVSIPKNSTVLKFGVQGNDIVFWVLCDPDQSKIPLRLTLFFTGSAIGVSNLAYLDTVEIRSGLVFHIFQDHLSEN